MTRVTPFFTDGRIRLAVDHSSTADVGDIRTCRPSPAAKSATVYTCGASAADLPACWTDPASTTTMMCMQSPTATKVIEFSKPSPDNMFSTPSSAETGSWTLTLDDGTVCSIRLGGTWSAPPKGYDETYGCGGSIQVLLSPKNGPLLDTSSAHWTVHASRSTADNPPVVVVGVMNVLYAGTAPVVQPADTGSRCPSMKQLAAALPKGETMSRSPEGVSCQGDWASAPIDVQGQGETAAFERLAGTWKQMDPIRACRLPGPLPAGLYPRTCQAG